MGCSLHLLPFLFHCHSVWVEYLLLPTLGIYLNNVSRFIISDCTGSDTAVGHVVYIWENPVAKEWSESHFLCKLCAPLSLSNMDVLSDSEEEFLGFDPSDIGSAPLDEHLDNVSEDSSDIVLSDLDSSSDSDTEYIPPPQIRKLPPPLWTRDHALFEPVEVPAFDEDTQGPNLPGYIDPWISTPVDYFKMFFSDELFEEISAHTNSYAEYRRKLKQDINPGYVDKKWSETTGEEIRAFIALNIIFGVSPSRRIRHYWSKNKFLHNAGVAGVMSSERFFKISEYFHVSDRSKEPPRGSSEYDCWYKVNPVLRRLQTLFPMMSRPTKNQSIDEGLQPFKGRDRKVQYCPDKPRKRGFKFWIRCDAETGYVQQFECYAGKKENNVLPASRNGLIFDVVEKLTRPLNHKNHHVYFDNFYTSIPTLLYLLSKNVFACGTIQLNRGEIPPGIKQFGDKGQRGEHIVYQDKRHPNLTICAWRDTKVVRFASTLANPLLTCKTQRRSGSRYMEILQPHAASLYGKFMGGVDNFDHLRERYRSGKPGKKAWKYLFFFLLDCALVNSYILYKATSQRFTSLRAKKGFDQFAFRMDLAPALVGGYSKREIVTSFEPIVFSQGDRTAKTHANTRLLDTRKQCAFHRKKFPDNPRHTTVYGCVLCGVHLCKRCHNEFHYS